MNEQCPKCFSEIRTVPAGVSKNTGRPYHAFQACSNRACDYKPFKRPANFPPRPNLTGPSQHEQLTEANRQVYAKMNVLEKMMVDITALLEKLTANNEEKPF